MHGAIRNLRRKFCLMVYHSSSGKICGSFWTLRAIDNPFYAKSECAWFWIDAICIDQSNIGERNHQVQLMRSIYSGAVEVLTWLGPAADDSVLTMSGIGSAGPRGPFFLETDDFFIPNRARRREAIVALFGRPYWRRVWIVQEVRLASRCLVMCGQSIIYSCRVFAFLWDLTMQTISRPSYSRSTRHALAVLDLTENGTNLPLSRIIQMF
jgi:hypothetical protein